LGRVERSIEIKAPPEKVWEMLALDKFPEWDEGTRKNVKSTEYVSEVRTPEDKYRVGTIARQTENRGKTLDSSANSHHTLFSTFLSSKLIEHLLQTKSYEYLMRNSLKD